MKRLLCILFILVGVVGYSQKSIKAQITAIAIEETDGSNSPYMEIVDSLGTTQSIWFQLAYSPMGTELMVGENIVVFCTPDEIQIGDSVISRCQYTMNDQYEHHPTSDVIIHYNEETNDLGDKYWVIQWIEPIEQ